MPIAPRKPCKAPGCGKLTEGSYCEKHDRKRQISQRERQKRYDSQRGSSTQRGYDYRWSKYSKLYRENNPLCVICEKEGIMTLAECVDHIIPVSGPNDPLFWDETNHQSLCWSCHSKKTASEDGGFGNSENVRFA